MKPLGANSGLHYVLALVWLALTVSLASWWLAIGLTLNDRMQRMFLWEGSAFIVLLITGACALVLAIRRENARRRALDTFFMSFTHDVKTSLARVQLQAEGLREDWPESAREPLDRLLHDTLRLQIQLENSLFVAQPDGRLLKERVNVGEAIERLAQDWPDLTVKVEGTARVTADARAFDAVIRNLLQNAVIHGGARHVTATVQPASGDSVCLRLKDDGRGVDAAAIEMLGQPFGRTSDTSGSGMGLFVSRQLISRMHGRLAFLPPTPDHHGLTVEFELPGAR